MLHCGKGYVFTHVCDSVNGRVGVCYPRMHCRWYPSMPCSRSPGGVCSRGEGCLLPGCLLQGVSAQGVCSRGYLLGGCLLGGVCSRGVCSRGVWPSVITFWFGAFWSGGLLVWCFLVWWPSGLVLSGLVAFWFKVALWFGGLLVQSGLLKVALRWPSGSKWSSDLRWPSGSKWSSDLRWPSGMVFGAITEGHYTRRPYQKAITEDHFQTRRPPHQKALPEGHNRRPLSTRRPPNQKVIAEGHNRRPQQKAMTEPPSSRPTPKGKIEGDQVQAHTQGENWGGSGPGLLSLPPPPPPQRSRLRHTVNEWPVCILLECILVYIHMCFCNIHSHIIFFLLYGPQIYLNRRSFGIKWISLKIYHNKNAFQWGAFRLLVDHIPACTAQRGCLLRGIYLGGCSPRRVSAGGGGGCVSAQTPVKT